jgi:hypothetical protein
MFFLLGVAIYFRVEFKFGMVKENHSENLNSTLSEIKKMSNKVEKLNFVTNNLQNFGIAFANDFKLFDQALYEACNPNCLEISEFYTAVSKVLDNLERNKMWVVRKNRTKDSVAYYIQSIEEAQIIQILSDRKKYFIDSQLSIKSDEMRLKSATTIALIDTKINEFKINKKTSKTKKKVNE